MPMPHTIQMQVIQERLKGKEGKARLKEISDLIEELPFNTGPYGELKKRLREELLKTKVRSGIKHIDWIGVKKQGIRQFAIVGCPNAGKSSLIKTMCGLQAKVGDYRFTTLKPSPGVVKINGAAMQLVDLPGLIEGASNDAGGGKKFIAIVRTADGIILMHDLANGMDETEKVVLELKKAGIDKPMIVVGSKVDLIGARENIPKLQNRFMGTAVIGVSAQTGEGIASLKHEIWKIAGLIRVYVKHNQKTIIADAGSTLSDCISKIHTDLVGRIKQARVTGKSVRFLRQQVGLDHVLEDGDMVEIALN